MREIEVSQGVRPIGVTVLRGRSEAAVLRQLKRLQRRGYIYAASPVSRFHRRAGGGYGVKVSLLRELPEPYPAWAKGIIAVGLSLTGMALLVILVIEVITALPAVMFVLACAVLAAATVMTRRAVNGPSVQVTQVVEIRR